MAANTSPIFVVSPRTSGISTGTSANTALDGTGTVATVFTAGANGSKIEHLTIIPLGSNIATVLRFFANNGSTNATAGNNSLVFDLRCEGNTLSQTAEGIRYTIPINLLLPASYKLNVTTGTGIASGFMVTAHGGDY